MKSFLPCLTLALATVWGSSESAAAAERFVERGVSFSYDLPKDFQPKLVPGQKYRLVFGPVVDGFAANVIVTEESFDGELEDYVEAALKQLEKATKGFKLVESKKFKTDDGLDSWVVVMEQDAHGLRLRQHLYVFPTDEKVLILTCSAIAAEQKTLDPLFTKAMKTFRFDK